jgi:hypothetical protein
LPKKSIYPALTTKDRIGNDLNVGAGSLLESTNNGSTEKVAELSGASRAKGPPYKQ